MALTPAQKRRLYYYFYQIGSGGYPGIKIWTSYFSERVTTDSGTMEAETCVTNALIALGSVSYYDLFELYKKRMLEDGAVIDNPCFDELMYSLVLLK